MSYIHLQDCGEVTYVFAEVIIMQTLGIFCFIRKKLTGFSLLLPAKVKGAEMNISEGHLKVVDDFL